MVVGLERVELVVGPFGWGLVDVEERGEGLWCGLLTILWLIPVLRLLAAILTTRLLRLIIAVLESAVLRCAVCALLLIVRLAVGRRGWGSVALVLLRIPAISGLLLVVRIRLRLAIRWCAAVATLLLLRRVVAGLVVIPALIVGVVAGHDG